MLFNLARVKSSILVSTLLSWELTHKTAPSNFILTNIINYFTLLQIINSIFLLRPTKSLQTSPSTRSVASGS